MPSTFEQAAAIVGYVILIHTSGYARELPNTRPWNCVICLSTWIALGVGLGTTDSILTYFSLVGMTALISAVMLCWLPELFNDFT